MVVLISVVILVYVTFLCIYICKPTYCTAIHVRRNFVFQVSLFTYLAWSVAVVCFDCISRVYIQVATQFMKCIFNVVFDNG